MVRLGRFTIVRPTMSPMKFTYDRSRFLLCSYGQIFNEYFWINEKIMRILRFIVTTNLYCPTHVSRSCVEIYEIVIPPTSSCKSMFLDSNDARLSNGYWIILWKNNIVLRRNIALVEEMSLRFIVNSLSLAVITVSEFYDLTINSISIVLSLMGKFIIELEELNVLCNLVSVYLDVFFE